jgi:hypothetical protein
MILPCWIQGLTPFASRSLSIALRKSQAAIRSAWRAGRTPLAQSANSSPSTTPHTETLRVRSTTEPVAAGSSRREAVCSHGTREGEDEMEIEVDNEEIRVSYQRGNCGVMVVAFAGGGLGVSGMQMEEFCSSLEEIGGVSRCHVIFIIDKRRTWYNNNLSAYFVDYANTLSRDLSISRVVTLGNSGGGFAAIAYARKFNRCAQAIAFCPQSSVHQAIVPFENRWPDWRSQISQWDVLDATAEIDPQIRYDIFFGANNFQDMQHAERFESAIKPNINLALIERCGHDVALFMKKRGDLNPILKKLIWIQ